MRRVRPTREGWVFLSTTLAVTLAALNTANNLLYLVMAAMLSLVTVSSLLSEWSIRGLRVSRCLEGQAFAGQPLGGRWRVENPRLRWPAIDIRVEERAAPLADLADRAPASFVEVAPGGAEVAGARWCFAQRGIHRMRGVRISTAWPFGIFRKWYELEAPLDVLVFPSRSSTQLRAGRSPGNSVAASDKAADVDGRRDAAGEFLGLADYHEGEDPRRIHWRSSARMGRLVAAERGKSQDQGCVDLVVESPPPGHPRQRSLQFEAQVSAVTGELCRSIDERREVRLHLLGTALPSANDEPGRNRLLRALALLELPEQRT